MTADPTGATGTNQGAAVGADEDGRPLYKVDPTCSCNFAGGCPDCLSYTQPANQGVALEHAAGGGISRGSVIRLGAFAEAARIAREGGDR